MTLGETIRNAREERGWTQVQLAAQIGVTPSFITKIEKNEVLPSPDRLQALVGALLLDGDRVKRMSHEARQERLQRRLDAQEAAVRNPYGLGAATPMGADRTSAEHLGREILDSPDLQAAVANLRLILADPDLRAGALRWLEALARDAKASNPQIAPTGRGGKRERR